MMVILATIASTALSAAPAGFLYTFVPRIIDGITKGGKPESEYSAKKLMERLNEIDARLYGINK